MVGGSRRPHPPAPSPPRRQRGGARAPDLGRLQVRTAASLWGRRARRSPGSAIAEFQITSWEPVGSLLVPRCSLSRFLPDPPYGPPFSGLTAQPQSGAVSTVMTGSASGAGGGAAQRGGGFILDGQFSARPDANLVELNGNPGVTVTVVEASGRTYRGRPMQGDGKQSMLGDQTDQRTHLSFPLLQDPVDQ